MNDQEEVMICYSVILGRLWFAMQEVTKCREVTEYTFVLTATGSRTRHRKSEAGWLQCDLPQSETAYFVNSHL